MVHQTLKQNISSKLQYRYIWSI